MMFARSATYATPARRLRRFGRAGAGARGFIMGYILFALMVLGIVVAVLSRINEAEAETKWVNDGVIRVKENLQTVRVQIVTCSALLGTTGTGDIEFPPQVTAGTPTPLQDLVCPQGNLGPVGLFDGSAGVFSPAPPRDFTPYVYVNNFNSYDPDDGPEAVWVETTVATAPGASVIRRIDLAATGPETEVTTTNGVTRLRLYLARREAAPT
jgi:hypothetical protein